LEARNFFRIANIGARYSGYMVVVRIATKAASDSG